MSAERITQTAAVHRAAPAKLNLYLHVVGRRPDGFHLLDSLVAFAAVHDTVSAERASSLSLALAGPFARTLSAEADNLVLRAARLLADVAGIRPWAALTLVKRLPVASGIGGGSADAAAALAVLTQLWRVEHKPGALARLALALGADLPVCIAGRAAQVSGIGETLDPAPAIPVVPLVLANPGIPLPTPVVFKARAGAFSKPAPLEAAPRDAKDLAEALARRRNDLTEAAISLVPAVRAVLDALAAAPGCLLARMSGSGATCFAIFAHEAEAQRAAEALRMRNERWWVCATTLLGDTATLQAEREDAARE